MFEIFERNLHKSKQSSFFKKKMLLVLGKKFGEMFVRELWQHALLEKITNLD